MKTKRIWIWSFIFGLFAALIVYLMLYSDNTTALTGTEPVDVTETDQSEGGQDTEIESEQIEAEIGAREVVNPIVEVSEGKRAISLNVTTVHEGVSGYIAPNSQVDIVSFNKVLDEETGKENLLAELVVQNAKVLTSGTSANTEAEALNYQTVTVEVNPKEGVMLSLAAKESDGFYFMLRNPEDEGVEEEVISISRELVEETGGSAE
ncbi:hypothetical protein GH741_16815 [Aquibacillus halophilus]|uniref:Flp pilus assembly protein RcpC/CpaB domain-containing protein n=1 Tax=Aquibacillus halophilus TaxID=930132 RepID=A0A6A8DMQ9_9BACI|nr:RcpC/CpaB family pilus assembly protein [Aquibacillus halophilus]MRH44307.1 hypothetical protein [Aquibacillus halophilus]